MNNKEKKKQEILLRCKYYESIIIDSYINDNKAEPEVSRLTEVGHKSEREYSYDT